MQTWSRIIGMRRIAMQAMIINEHESLVQSSRTGRADVGHACHEESKNSCGVEGQITIMYLL